MYGNAHKFYKLISRFERGLKIVGSAFDSGTMSQPVFVIGTGRCGSTLFSAILDSSSSLLVYPHEGNSLWFPASYPYARSQIDVPPILQEPAMYTARSIAAWPSRQADCIRNTLNGFHRLCGASRPYIYKSAMHSFMVRQILEIFPEARFIHLYRNGFSVVASLLEKEWHKYSELTTKDEFMKWCAGYWNACIEEIDKVDREMGLGANGKLFELSYEQLCESPVDSVRSLAGFIGVSADGFGYDYTGIRSTNFKAQDADRPDLLEVMRPALQLKGYLD